MVRTLCPLFSFLLCSLCPAHAAEDLTEILSQGFADFESTEKKTQTNSLVPTSHSFPPLQKGLSDGLSYGLSEGISSLNALFDPTNPRLHGTWKGRKTLPLAPFRALVAAIVRYLGLPLETTPFLLEIAAAESDFGYYVRQVRGPAQSVWQIEPETARDMHARLPRKNPSLYRKIVALRDPGLSEEQNIVTNLNYGCALCAGILYLKGIRFETLHSLEARAMAWKKYYNTYLGKGTLEGYCQKAKRHLGEQLSANPVFSEPFDAALLQGGDAFSVRDSLRFTTLPDDFDTSTMGRYYARILRERPEVFEEIPQALFASQTVQDIAKTLLWQLIRDVQQNPAHIAHYSTRPPEIFLPLVRAALNENALAAYPYLPPDLQKDPEVIRIYETHKFLLEHMP